MGSEILTMILVIITLLVLPSLQRTHILTVDAAAFYFNKDHESSEQENRIKKISSGLDEREEKEAMIVEKFRALLGLKSFHSTRRAPSSEFLFSPSPSPSPSIEAEAIAPAPSPVHQLHHHHHSLHRHWNHHPPLSYKTHDEDRGRGARRRRVVVAVVVSLGVAVLICACGLILLCRKLRNQGTKRKKPKRTILPLCGGSGKSNKGSREGTNYQNSSIDLFYLDSLGEDIEQHACTLKEKSCDNNDNNNNAGDSSTTKDILLTVHESESDGDEIVIPDPEEECNSSDDESFHSLVDSQSNARLSNASNGSSLISDAALSILSPQNSSLLLSPHNPISKVQQSHQPPQEIIVDTTPVHQCVKSSSPPPPPPPQMPLFALHSLTTSSSSGASSSHSPFSLTSHNLSSSSPRNSDTFSGSNQSPEKDFPSPPPPPNNTVSTPPCPPPFPNSFRNSSAKTPPPPPSQHPQFSALGKDGAPLPKLKPLHWDKVRAAPNRTMVWDKLRTSSFELDEEMIESLFGYNLQSSIKNDETKSKSPSPSKHVLEPKRLQNITILSKALNATAEHVCEALIQGKGLTLQQLEALVKMVPTKEEEANLSNYKGNINELGSAERFVRAMLSVPVAFQRVEGMLYKETFEDEVVHLRNSFSMLEEACKELKSSRLFLKLLETVLKTGNRMNVGTIRGGARAFKLDALLKLADVKGVDGKTTLLHFVVQEIVRSEGIRVSDSIMGKISSKKNNNKNVMTEEEKEEDYRRMGLELVSGLSTELYNVKKTATIDLDVLASSVSNLSEEMAKLQHLVEKELRDDEDSAGGFVKTMTCFLSYAERKLKELRGDEDRVLARVKEIAEYFHGDNVSKEDGNPLRIFVIVRDFLGMLDSVCKELRRSKAPRSPNPLAPFR